MQPSSADKGPLVGQGRSAEVYEFGEGQVLKLFRAGLPAEWVQREIEVARAVTEAGLPAPAFMGIAEVDGRSGIVYERVDGPSMLQKVAGEPWRLFDLAGQFAELHATIHGQVVHHLPSQRLQMLHMIGRADALSPADKEAVPRQLDALPDGMSVCHGDYHPDNVVLSEKGPIVIDWTTASRGNPAADVARTILLFQMGSLPPGMSAFKSWITQRGRSIFLSEYLRRYLALRPVDETELDAWRGPLAAARLAEGLPGEESKLLEVVRLSVQPPPQA